MLIQHFIRHVVLYQQALESVLWSVCLLTCWLVFFLLLLLHDFRIHFGNEMKKKTIWQRLGMHSQVPIDSMSISLFWSENIWIGGVNVAAAAMTTTLSLQIKCTIQKILIEILILNQLRLVDKWVCKIRNNGKNRVQIGYRIIYDDEAERQPGKVNKIAN